MRVIFSPAFKRDLLEAQTRYASILPKLGDEFSARVKVVVQSIIARQGGDHVGPHGFHSRKCRPFPHLVYYQIGDDTLYVLGLIHERRHPRPPPSQERGFIR